MAKDKYTPCKDKLTDRMMHEWRQVVDDNNHEYIFLP